MKDMSLAEYLDSKFKEGQSVSPIDILGEILNYTEKYGFCPIEITEILIAMYYHVSNDPRDTIEMILALITASINCINEIKNEHKLNISIGSVMRKIRSMLKK